VSRAVTLACASVVAAGALGACTAAQSARVLAPGKTQVSVGANRVTATDEDGVLWSGQVMVRRGLADKVDVGVILDRTPGSGEATSMLAVEPKVQLTAPGGNVTVSLALGAGVIWADGMTSDGLDAELGGYMLSPTAFLGFELAPGAELVAAPRLHFVFPDGEDDHGTAYGASIGVRFTDPARTWAVHPEVTYMTIEDTFVDESFLTLGVSVSAGD
jgi:hypothetical protein